MKIIYTIPSPLSTINVMPAFGMNPNVAPHINDIYRYIKARADGKIRRGVRLPKLPKYKE